MTTPPVRSEFKLRSTDPRDVVASMAYAGATGYMIFVQYGWVGIVVGTTLLGVAQHFKWTEKKMERDMKALGEFAEEFPNEDTPEEIRLQKTCDALAPKFGLGRIPTTMIKPSNAAAFCSPSRVFVTSELVSKLDQKELAFVVGHELDHIRSKDHRMNTIFYDFGVFNSLASGLSIVALMSSLHLNNLSGFWPIATAFVATSLTAAFSRAALSRGNEFRGDANAATVTGWPRSGMTGLRDTIELVTKSKNLPKTRGLLSELMMSHPQVQHRLRRLQKMGHQNRVQKFIAPLVARFV